jgi:molybdate transport system substrate-binding protein
LFSRNAASVVLTVLLCAATVAGPRADTAAAETSVTVFAAASLKNALDDVDAAFTRSSGVRVVASYAASSTLARQIEQGAPARVFLSADVDWMDYAEQKKLIAAGTRVNLLGNKLVLIAPKDSSIGEVTIAPGVDLVALAAGGRIATGDVRAVPAGRYAKAALEKLDIWDSVAPRLAPAESVRAALALVARGEAALGIVYATDARIEPNVKIVGTFPADSHPPIIYPVAAVAAPPSQALAYLAFLRTAAAKAIFERYGFTFLPPPTS